MLRDLKYILIGLSISVVLFCLLLGAFMVVSPGSLSPAIPLPAFLDTLTPSFTSIPSDTPIPPTAAVTSVPPEMDPPLPTSVSATATTIPLFTPTLDPGQELEKTGGLVISGPLSPEQQIQLYDASLQFLAPTFSEARRIGETINGKGYGSPTLICGPLSIAILRAAGLIPITTVPYKFWQLNPDDPLARELLKSIFPPDRYSDTRIRTRIDKFDWETQPLQPGDFIYIYAGTGGNFEHMLVVNRVDDLGRAYSVTNYNTPNGFIIKEVLLYDPGDPTAGVFREWTARQYALLGSTGFGGFELWRLIPTNPAP